MISIIIPTYNRSDSLKGTLESIAKQNFEPNDFEVIVIDNGSTDDTKKICSIYESVINKFTYYYDDIPGLLTGRHRGAELAKGDVLSFIDDDVELSPNWLNGIAESFDNSEISLATGPCLPKYEVAPPAWLAYFWGNTPYGGKECASLSLLDLGSEIIKINPNYVWGLNFSIRKSVLLSLGGFHPDCIPAHLQQYQGDGETGLTIKAAKLGLTAIYNPKIMLHHLVSAQRMTLEYFKKRAYYLGVCNSFTDVRNKHFDPVVLDKISTNRLNLARVYGAIRRRIFKSKGGKKPTHIIEMQNLLWEAEKKGYQFHQEAFENNNLVREWALKVSYWEFKLPGND